MREIFNKRNERRVVLPRTVISTNGVRRNPVIEK
jgi:hypothetical protein